LKSLSRQQEKGFEITTREGRYSKNQMEQNHGIEHTLTITNAKPAIW